MELKGKLFNIIQTENKKDPLTDIQIAKFLGTNRESITNLRKEFNIPNSRQRRLPYLKSAISAILFSDSNASVSEITRELMTQGFDISRRVVEEILAKEEIKETEKEFSQEVSMEEKDPFSHLIGYNGSLKNAIEQAKSAVLYPPNGLPTLIVGESGVGKSLFSQKIYEFSKQKRMIKENAEFIVFNCADYGDNPQLLLSLLFGYKKGAFTGADQDTAGLVEKADGGVLFLDEIHRLPPKGQEILFSILDRGTFRRLGDSSVERKVSLFLIGATTESLEESLLLTFRRRIPMVISLPSLQERSLEEKVVLIDTIFQQECNRIHSKIFLDKRVIEVLLFEKFSGNIGQLQNKILVLCARAFLKYINDKEKQEDAIVTIDVNEMLYLQSEETVESQSIDTIEIRKYLKNKIFLPFQSRQKPDLPVEQKTSMPEDIYIKLEQRYHELKRLNIPEEEMQNALWTFLTTSFTDLDIDLENNKDFSMTELNAFVSEDILKEVKKLREEISGYAPSKEINSSVFRYLAIHLEVALKRVRLDQKIININLEKIKTDYPKEFAIAEQFSKKLETIRKIQIPVNEIGFIALYIRTALKEQQKKDMIGLMVVSHGKIATEMVKVVRSLLNTKHIVALDMPLEERVMDIYNKATELAKLIDQGKGILILVDIGSLTSVGEIITERTGIPTRTIDRVELAMTIEATRKVSLGEQTLDEVYFSLIKERMGNYSLIEERKGKQNAIITLCMTGEGTANYISDSLQEKYPDILYYNMSALSETLQEDIEKIRENYHVLAAVGTIDPQIPGLDFISYDKDTVQKLEMRLVSVHSGQQARKYEQLINEELILFEPDVYFKKDILEWICVELINKGIVEKEYMSSVRNREKISPTYTKGGIAVPHGNPSFVNHTSFVFIKLKNLIDWDVGNVDFIFMPVFKTGDKEEVKQMLQILSDDSFVQAMKQSRTEKELKKVIFQKIKNIEMS